MQEFMDPSKQANVLKAGRITDKESRKACLKKAPLVIGFQICRCLSKKIVKGGDPNYHYCCLA